MNKRKELNFVIKPDQLDRHYWHDLWNYRELFYVLAWRDIAVRYKQTVIGIAWALLRPLITMIVFTFVFGVLAKLPTNENVPYPLMVFVGLLPWQLFSGAISESSNSLIGNAGLISKVFFPRIIIPIASIIVVLVDFLIGSLMMICMMIWYGFLPNWHILFLPIFILMSFFASLGPALLISSLNVKYRDFRYVIPFLIQIGLYISPVGFDSQVIPDDYKLLYSLNPMASIIEGFRWSILGKEFIYIPGLAISTFVIIFFLWLGIRKFRSMEKTFSDLI